MDLFVTMDITVACADSKMEAVCYDLLVTMDITVAERRYIENGLLEHTNNTSAMFGNMLSWSQMQMNGVGSKKMANSYQVIEINQEIMVITDINIVQIVIRNLVTNALKFPPAGEIVILRIDEANDFI